MNTGEGQQVGFMGRMKSAAIDTATEAMKHPVSSSATLVSMLMAYAGGFPMHMALTMGIIVPGFNTIWHHAKVANEDVMTHIQQEQDEE